MASGGSSIGGTITNGIQDLSALLPLLGTEQCENHIGSALTDGFLYAAATPMSIFGSLGVARAGFKTLLSATSIPRLKFDGVKILAAVRFKPEGTNLLLIMFDEEGERYCCEKSMMEELHVEDSNKISVSSKTRDWNIMMILATAVSCIISITPYIHLNLHEPNKLDHFVRWAFPVIRAMGGFLTATMIQLVIQYRLLAIMRKRLILDGLGEEKRKGPNINGKELHLTLDQCFAVLEQDVRLKSPVAPTALLPDGIDLEPGLAAEAAGKDRENLQSRIKEANGSSIVRWTFLILLFIGIIASVVGYVGCFSAVQGSGSSKEALIWLCLEAGLSIVRIILWAINPKGDDAPPLEFKFQLDEHPPLPTCIKSAEEIEELKVLPLVRATEFLEGVTSYAGLLHRFSPPRLTLYYTLTRRFHAASDPDSNRELSPSERVLYITIFDHTERTTRVYSGNYQAIQDGGDGNDDENDDDGTDGRTGAVWNVKNAKRPDSSYFYSADPVTVNLEHSILRTSIGHEIHHEDDPIAGNIALRTQLAKHYHSILNQVNSRTTQDSHFDTLENDWMLNLGEEESHMQKKGEVEKEAATVDGDRSLDRARDHKYLEHGPLERKVRDLIPVRGTWVEDYMNWLHKKVEDDLAQLKEVHNIEVEKYELEVVELLLIQERAEMEMILADEVHGWEEQLKEHRVGVSKWLVDNGGMSREMREELDKRERADLWERLEAGRSAMTARMAAAESNFLQRVTGAGKKGANETRLKNAWTKLATNIRDTWESLFENIESTPTTLSPSTSSPRHGRLKNALERYREDFEAILRYRDVNETVRQRCRERIRKREIRLESEVQDVDERLGRGFEHCQELKSDEDLVDLTHSDSKWLEIDLSRDGAIRALSRNNHVIYVFINAGSASSSDISQFFAVIRNTTSCTSIYLYRGSITDTIKVPPNILSFYPTFSPIVGTEGHPGDQSVTVR